MLDFRTDGKKKKDEEKEKYQQEQQQQGWEGIIGKLNGQQQCACVQYNEVRDLVDNGANLNLSL